MQTLRPVLAALLLLSPFAANGTLITFDDLADGTPLTDQYAGLGVTFDGRKGVTNFAPEVRTQQFLSVPHSAPNYLTNFYVPGANDFDSRLGKLFIDFDGVADNVSVWVNTASAPGEADSLTFNLFDENNVNIGATLLAGSGVDNVFHIVGSGIGRMVVTGPRNNWWWALDDLSFDLTPVEPPLPVPEPGTLALFGIGLLGMGLARRRKTA